jgi:hypothetical protein
MANQMDSDFLMKNPQEEKLSKSVSDAANPMDSECNPQEEKLSELVSQGTSEDDSELIPKPDRLSLAAGENLDTRLVDIKATKGDDAQVQVEQWNLQVIKGMRKKLTLDEVKEAHEALRRFGGTIHKKRVTQGFFSWLHQKPKYQQVGVGEIHTVRLAGIMNPQDAADGLEVIYEWSDHGRAVYMAWWEQRSRNHGKYLVAARDVIGRIADADWFEWSAGSWCVHWKWPVWYQ